MTTKHTPGPWKAQVARSGSNRLQVSSASGKQIALIWRHSSEETTANKLLIAAAPDLLNALRTLADAAESRGIPCDAARAAIARAAGEVA